VVDDNKMLLVNFQALVSGDGGLNEIPIKVATTTVRELSTACCWGGHTLFCLLLSIILLLRTNLTINNCSVLLQQNETIEVVDNNTMLLVDFQAQVSRDVGLNDIPINVATTTVRELSTACG
jgi:hypothetical protein